MRFGFLKSKIYLIFILCFIVFLAYANYQVYKKNQLETANLLKKEFKEQKQENQRLSELKEYLTSDIYLERQARAKFKLQKPGEKVVILEESTEPSLKTDSKKDIPNFLKWWYYLARQ